MSVAQACKVLGLGHTISSTSEIVCAFRDKVKSAANGNGGYVRDMDNLTQAKEIVLTAFNRAWEEAQMAEARKRAQEAERQEREALKRKRAQRKPTPEKVVLLLSASGVSPYEAIRTFERRRQEAYHLFKKMREQQMNKVVQTNEQERSVGDTLTLLTLRKNELAEVRERERALGEELRLLQTRRIALEQAVEKAIALSEQMQVILEAVEL
jgi:hypothetical protein